MSTVPTAAPAALVAVPTNSPSGPASGQSTTPIAAPAAAPTDSLMSLLITELGQEEAARLYEKFLRPLYEAVEKKTYPLPLPENMSAGDLKQQTQSALAAFTACEKVVFFSIGNPFPKTEWMTQEAYDASLRTSFRNILWGILLDSLRSSLRDSLRDIF